MNKLVNTASTPNTHPIILIAGTAIILLCAVGTAAIMGWIPTSVGSNPDSSTLTQSAQVIKPAHHTPTHAVPNHATIAATPVPTPSKIWCSNCGIVESTREITTRAQGSGLGAAGGAVVGGLLGNQVGGGRGRDVMTVVGAIGGAVAGNQIEGQVKATRSYEIIVRLNDGATRTFYQAQQPGWSTGDHVKIVDGALRSNG